MLGKFCGRSFSLGRVKSKPQFACSSQKSLIFFCNSTSVHLDLRLTTYLLFLAFLCAPKHEHFCCVRQTRTHTPNTIKPTPRNREIAVSAQQRAARDVWIWIGVLDRVGAVTASRMAESARDDDIEELREQDRFLPIANINRIVKRRLPYNAKVAKEAKETTQVRAKQSKAMLAAIYLVSQVVAWSYCAAAALATYIALSLNTLCCCYQVIMMAISFFLLLLFSFFLPFQEDYFALASSSSSFLPPFCLVIA